MNKIDNYEKKLFKNINMWMPINYDIFNIMWLQQSRNLIIFYKYQKFVNEYLKFIYIDNIQILAKIYLKIF